MFFFTVKIWLNFLKTSSFGFMFIFTSLCCNNLASRHMVPTCNYVNHDPIEAYELELIKIRSNFQNALPEFLGRSHGSIY